MIYTTTELSEQPFAHLLPQKPLLIGYRGSVAHGTYHGNDHEQAVDDIDIMSVHAGPLQHYLGFRKKDQETVDQFEGQWDVVSHEVRKFIRLLSKNNPNVMDLLFLPDDLILWENDQGRLLRENRDLFLSKKAYHAFRGYAHSQLDDIEKDTYKGYMGEKRKRLADRHGYDTKHASHVIRLLRMGIEYLREGKVTLPRPDADELLSIKEGEWALEGVLKYTDQLFKALELAREKSPLPDEPDRDKIEELLVDVVMEAHDLFQYSYTELEV